MPTARALPQTDLPSAQLPARLEHWALDRGKRTRLRVSRALLEHTHCPGLVRRARLDPSQRELTALSCTVLANLREGSEKAERGLQEQRPRSQGPGAA